MTAGALAQELEVSQRTILRDIDELSAAGVPIWADRGREGGLRLREGWSTTLTGMTESEASALLLAGLPGPATELGLGASAASARLKLLASLPKHWREQADMVGQRLHVDSNDWYRSVDQPRFLREVAEAVWSSRFLCIHYESWRGASRQKIEPLGLVLKAGAWYLVAGRDAQVRTYRLASVTDLKTSPETFTRPRGFDLAEWWLESTTRFENELRHIIARVSVSPRAVNRLRNSRHAVSLPLDGEQQKWIEVEWAIESIEQGALELLALGAEVEVIAPPELRAEMIRQICDLDALYQV